MKSRMLATVVGTLVLAVAGVVYAYSQNTATRIIKIGCNNVTGYALPVDNYCEIVVANAIPGYAGCLNRSSVFFDATTPYGKSVLALATSAFIAGKQVGVDVARCSPVPLLKDYAELRGIEVF